MSFLLYPINAPPHPYFLPMSTLQDMARLLLPVKEPRTRIDAATWGTMGVGLGSAIAAAVQSSSAEAGATRPVIAVEGDSAFGFSGMELETIVRYQLPVVVFVMNNGGIYGGDRRWDSTF